MSTFILMSECCRCCLAEENDMIYVFDILDEFDSKICDLITGCGGITITESDMFSKNICGSCLNDLANAARFRKRCLRTEQIMQNTTVDKEPEEVNQQVIQSDLTDNDYLEEIVIEQIEEYDENHVILEEDQIIEFTDNHSMTDENDSNIEYIVTGDNTDLDLEEFDYNNLISGELDEEIETIRSRQLPESSKTNPKQDQKITEKSQKFPQPSPLTLNFVCQQCGAGFALQKNLAKHLTTHQNFVCDICLILFKSDKDLDSHKVLHEEGDVSSQQLEQLLQLEEDDLKTCQLQNPKKNHICSYCGKAFVSNSALTSHVRVHTQERPYPCGFCTKRFRTVGAQELHERRHSGLKPYKCDICGRGFAESSNLKVHRRTHTKEKPHICTICNRAFARVFLLKIHQRTHTGERPFSCEDCGKPFSQQGDLAAHRRIHTGERPHKCGICGKGFIKSSGLTQHRKKHDKKMSNIRTMDVMKSVGEMIEDYDEYEIKIVQEERDVQKDDALSAVLFES